MEKAPLSKIHFGKTGFEASKVGLGCGGQSRLGQRQGQSSADSVKVVREALDLGINIIDTAKAYETESIVAKALKEAGSPDAVFVSTKIPARPDATEKAINGEIEERLKALETDCIDLLYLHGVPAAQYAEIRDRHLPVLEKAKEAGKIRFHGVTEQFEKDFAHAMLDDALRENEWDAVMVGFNLLNSSARTRVFPRTQSYGTAVQIMFAVRRALHDQAYLKEVIRGLVDDGKLREDFIDLENPLGFILESDEVESLPEAAYRYVLGEPGAEVILVGTGNVEHLRANVEAIRKGPLSPALKGKIDGLLGHLDCVSGS